MGLLNWLGLTAPCEKDPVALDDKNFHAEVMASELPVLVDFWSDGCQPCVQLAPAIKRLACKYEGRVKVAHLNTTQSAKSAAKLGVRGTPTVIIFDKGRVVERVVGLRGQHYFEEILQTELGISGEEAPKA